MLNVQKNKTELLEKKDKLEKELKEINEILSKNKDSIKKFFLNLHDENVKDLLASKISRVRKYNGFLDTRKNEMKYESYIYEIMEGLSMASGEGHN